MATITITIPDDAVPDVVEAFAQTHRWRSVEEDGPRNAFPRKIIIQNIRNLVRTYRLEQAAATARTQAESTADVDVT